MATLTHPTPLMHQAAWLPDAVLTFRNKGNVADIVHP